MNYTTNGINIAAGANSSGSATYTTSTKAVSGTQAFADIFSVNGTWCYATNTTVVFTPTNSGGRAGMVAFTVVS